MTQRLAFRSIGLALGWVLGAAIQAQAVPITVPTALNPGDSYRLVFVTSTTRDGTSSDIADYNAFVTSVANGVPQLAALGTTWKAIASTVAVAAIDNTSTYGAPIPVYLLNDTMLRFGDSLWGGTLHVNPFDIDENGNLATANYAWTGTKGSGQPEPSFEMGTATPNFGYIHTTVFVWVESGQDIATDQYPMYAISGVLTVVPEPGTAALLAVGLIAMAVVRRRSA